MTKDLDVLVRRVDGPQVVERLVAAGYVVLSELAIPGQATGQAEQHRRVVRLSCIELLEMGLRVGEVPQGHLELGKHQPHGVGLRPEGESFLIVLDRFGIQA